MIPKRSGDQAVTFLDGTTALGTATLSSGRATFKTSVPAIGSHLITALYAGDANFLTSTSPILTQTVNPDGTTIRLTASANPSVSGQAVTFTATVSAAYPGSGTPTGTITFYDGSLKVGTAAPSGGAAALTTSALSAGTHAIRVVYGGDVDFKSSPSAILSQVVKSAPAATVVTTAISRSLAASAADLAIAALQDNATSEAPPDELARFRIDTRDRRPLSPPMEADRMP